MLPLPFAVCARPCATNAVLCTRDGQRFLPFARAPIELLPPHAFLNPTECEIECSNHRPRRLGEFRLMNAGDRRGPLGSHSFILGHTPRLITSFYCAVSRSPARSFKQLAPSTLAIAIGRRKAAVAKSLASALTVHLRGAARRDFSPLRATSTLSIYIRLTTRRSAQPPPYSFALRAAFNTSTLLALRSARTVREWPKHRKNALDFVERNQTGSEPPRRLHSNSRRNPSL